MVINDNCPPNEQPLKYHFRVFRQAVLCNMKSRGPEYDWDEGQTPGTDPIRDISSSEEGKLRFELIMGEKLNAIIA
jgi:hypothetical protein